MTNTVLTGLVALVWLLMRSAPKPSRIVYPCQQAAFSTASLAFGAPLVSALVVTRHRLVAGFRTPLGVAVALVGLVVTLGVWGWLNGVQASPAPLLVPSDDYRAQVFSVTSCPQDPVGDRFEGLDTMLQLMGSNGLKIYRGDAVTTLSGPDGIIATDDVVIIKINYQWGERGGTNTDLLRGLIRAHRRSPGRVPGEIVVCENAQFNSTSGFDRDANNAQDHGLSPHDVVAHFQGLGHPVSHYDWTPIRYTSVSEYSDGDAIDGYIVYPYDSALHGAISYPKFETDAGTMISLRDGIWDPVGRSYDRDRLKFINVPVLKSHSATYGATACVKHYMGVVTRELSHELTLGDPLWSARRAARRDPAAGPQHPRLHLGQREPRRRAVDELRGGDATGSAGGEHRPGGGGHLGRHQCSDSRLSRQRLRAAVARSRTPPPTTPRAIFGPTSTPR